MIRDLIFQGMVIHPIMASVNLLSKFWLDLIEADAGIQKV